MTSILPILWEERFLFSVIDLSYDSPSHTLGSSAEIGPNPACLLLNTRKTVLILVGAFPSESDEVSLGPSSDALEV